MAHPQTPRKSLRAVSPRRHQTLRCIRSGRFQEPLALLQCIQASVRDTPGRGQGSPSLNAIDKPVTTILYSTSSKRICIILFSNWSCHSAVFCVSGENKKSRFRLEIRILLSFAFLQSGATRNRNLTISG